MNRHKINNSASIDGIKEFIDGFNEILSIFQSGTETVMNIVTGSFEKTGKHSEAVSALFGLTKTEAEEIFSIFTGIASIFTGGNGGGILGSLFDLLPGGGLLTAIFGSALSPTGLQPVGNLQHESSNSQIGTIYVPALPKEGYYQIHKTGKELAELRPAK